MLSMGCPLLGDKLYAKGRNIPKNISKDINPFSNPDWAAHQKTAVRSGRDTSNDAIGKVLINTANSSTAVYISACFETPCSSSSNTLSTTININP